MGDAKGVGQKLITRRTNISGKKQLLEILVSNKEEAGFDERVGTPVIRVHISNMYGLCDCPRRPNHHTKSREYLA